MIQFSYQIISKHKKQDGLCQIPQIKSHELELNKSHYLHNITDYSYNFLLLQFKLE